MQTTTTRRWSLWKAALGCLIAAVLSGCAHQTRTSGIDVERLLNAIELDDPAYVRDLVASGVATPDSRVPAPVYPDGAPLITLAARDGALEVMRYLLSAGANVDAVTPVGETALMLATYFPIADSGQSVQQRYEQAVRLLLEAGATTENDIFQYTPLSYAAFQNRQRIMRFLLAKGARVDGEVAGGITYSNTPLMMAAMQGHYDAALSLLRAGANPSIRSYRGTTAAELAAKYHHGELASLLRCAQQSKSVDALEIRCKVRLAAP